MKIYKDYSLKSLNTFGVDAKAKAFVEINLSNDLRQFLESKEFDTQRVMVLGGGSNILFLGDYEGVIVKLNLMEIKIIDEDEKIVLIEAGAGVAWGDLIRYCLKRNYGGIENLTLIPGSVGAAPIQNIGAYGQELKNVVHSVKGIYLDTKKSLELGKSDCRFSYRSSIFKNEMKNKFIITSVKLILNKNPQISIEYGALKEEMEKFGKKKLTIKDVSDAVAFIRRRKLPDPSLLGNAGSFFKNPEIDSNKYEDLKKAFPDLAAFPAELNMIKLSAGWLIEKCGWKGKRVGNVGTFQKQALVIVNYGGATGKEIFEFSQQIKNDVYEKFNIKLEEEVNII